MEQRHNDASEHYMVLDFRPLKTWERFRCKCHFSESVFTFLHLTEENAASVLFISGKIFCCCCQSTHRCRLQHLHEVQGPYSILLMSCKNSSDGSRFSSIQLYFHVVNSEYVCKTQNQLYYSLYK